MFPHILTMLRMLDPLAGSPQLLQSGPITARPLMLIFVATHRASLGEAGGFRECCRGIDILKLSDKNPGAELKSILR